MPSSQHAEAAASNDAIARILRKGNKETFDAAKDAIMKRVLLATVQEAIEDLGTPNDIAERALLHVEEEQASLHDAVARVKARLLEGIARRSTDELVDAEATAEQARTRIDDEHEALVGAKEHLKKRLIHEIAWRSTNELADAEAAALEARQHIDDEHEVLVRSKETLSRNLIDEIAQRAADELADAEATAEQVRARIDDEHEAVVGAVDELKKRLIDEIARRSTDEIADTEAVARQAQALIADEHTAILQAVEALKAQILETIVEQSLAKISDEVNTPLAIEELFQPKPARKAYVKNSVIEARPPSPPPRADAPGAPSSSPQMRRKRATNGYMVEDDALPELRFSEKAEADVPDRYYVYGIVANHGLALADVLAEADIDPPYTPHLMSHQAVTALVSCLPGAALQDISQVEMHRVQERLLDHVNASGIAVLPMYAETTHPSQAYLKKALEKYADTLDRALKNLAGKQEWNVKIYCHSEKVQQEVYAQDETIDSFLEQFVETADVWGDAGGKAELAALQTGMDTSIPEVIETILGNCQRNCHRTLDAVAIDYRRAPASDDSVFGNNRMVLNASYLVFEEQGEAFRAVLERLAVDYEQLGLVYYIGGPHLPCRFASPETPTL